MTKFVTFSDAKGARLGAVLDNGDVLDLAATGGPADMLSLIAGGPAALAAARSKIAAATSGLPASSVKLLAPIPRPARNVFCVGRNYMDHVAEGDRTRGITNSELPKFPQFFTKAPETVIGPDEWTHDHAAVTKWLDYEVELTLIIGTAGANISLDDSMKHVWGYTIANDVTGRDLQRRYGQWFKGKSLDRSCPLGPWIVPADELDGLNTGVRCFVNGEKRQDSHTSKMIFNIKQIIEQLSIGFTLVPGDIIMTGTPEGVGYAMVPPKTLVAGDVIRCEVDGIGSLTTTVKAD
jgi:2-keto-4-pentenoate hydratase/2-oxohepta-3-ene-1,7-dioic acid hydratase in catechol pathway